ncbi:MAG: hypothetical protein QGG34_14380 [SAR202 cluster bacterium]|nr:hypothetical protein [SAR202 cluster bacterium]MDP7103024.1 hypothetical protein [SAR202 cluster bacterium]
MPGILPDAEGAFIVPRFEISHQSFVCPQPGIFIEPRALDLNMLMLGVEKMVRTLIGESITFALDLELDQQVVRADPGQLEQVSVNLVINTRDTMPNGGELTVRTNNVRFSEPQAGQHSDIAAGDWGCRRASES